MAEIVSARQNPQDILNDIEQCDNSQRLFFIDIQMPEYEMNGLELARKLNNTDYVSKPAEIYVSNPEISIPHSKTGTLDRDSEKYRISEKNITKANNTDLEFRTVVQNLVNREQHLKMSFQIIGADGKTVKYQEERCV